MVWLMNGITIASSSNVTNLASGLEIEQVGDTNGDGKPDLIPMNTSSGAVSVLLQEGGSGTLSTVSLDWEIQN